ncbi:TssN family type VI secretion system protein [Persicitalea jodogahamensis]|uniref:Uncharacterized protein n=1 Tax=Persicitalea jodogahamensis TaxID=402147 RepID=A0A8J3D3A2_9BACT|nr:TssN family type VI secretion system protein [Persicitalea jodogahamensis]GHB52132.1 hypothetical protein GCM10007390_00950 [Persicitalea jodogahamensis]
MTPSVPQPKAVTRSAVYAAIAALLLTLAGSLGLANTDFGSSYALIMFAFLVLGCVHVWALHHWLPEKTGSLVKEFGFTLLLTLLTTGLLAALYRFVAEELPRGLGVATALVAFVFPIVAAGVYAAFLRIPPKEYKQWYYPVGQPLPDMDLLDLSRVLVIQFEFTKQADETAFTNFRAKAPVSMLLGELFFIFLNDYNDRNPDSPIAYLDAAQRPYGWTFYKKTNWYQRRRYLDPDLTFQANKVVDNETIVAVRST